MHHRYMLGWFKGCRLARISSGRYCLVRDLGLVKGGKGMRHHEVVIAPCLRELLRWLRKPSARRFQPEVPESIGQQPTNWRILRRGLFPRRLLLATFRLQPERAAREARGVEIALGADALEVQHGAQAVRRRF